MRPDRSGAECPVGGPVSRTRTPRSGNCANAWRIWKASSKGCGKRSPPAAPPWRLRARRSRSIPVRQTERSPKQQARALLRWSSTPAKGPGIRKCVGENACWHDWLPDLDADEVVSEALACDIRCREAERGRLPARPDHGRSVGAYPAQVPRPAPYQTLRSPPDADAPRRRLGPVLSSDRRRNRQPSQPAAALRLQRYRLSRAAAGPREGAVRPPSQTRPALTYRNQGPTPPAVLASQTPDPARALARGRARLPIRLRPMAAVRDAVWSGSVPNMPLRSFNG